MLGQRGGCMIVDSTRKGKRFPDSMSKTIPIWTSVLNRAIVNYRNKMLGVPISENNVSNDNMLFPQHHYVTTSPGFSNHHGCGVYAHLQVSSTSEWDCSLHLPLWVPETEKAAIEDHLEDWTKQLEDSGADISSFALSLKKPLRPLWVSPKTVIWLNEVPEYDSWDFTPIILVSASSSDGRFQQRTTSEFSWNYIPGAGDDEESWARGLTPGLFWIHAYDIVNLGPDMCNQKVADIVEKDRVYRAQRGHFAPQRSVKVAKLAGDNGHFPANESEKPDLEIHGIGADSSCANIIFWLGLTNLAVGAIQHGKVYYQFDL